MTFVFLDKFLAEPTLKTTFDTIKPAEYADLAAMLAEIKPDDKFKVKGIPKAQLDAIAERGALKTAMVDLIMSNNDVAAWRDAIKEKIRGSIGVAQLF